MKIIILLFVFHENNDQKTAVQTVQVCHWVKHMNISKLTERWLTKISSIWWLQSSRDYFLVLLFFKGINIIWLPILHHLWMAFVEASSCYLYLPFILFANQTDLFHCLIRRWSVTDITTSSRNKMPGKKRWESGAQKRKRKHEEICQSLKRQSRLDRFLR